MRQGNGSGPDNRHMRQNGQKPQARTFGQPGGSASVARRARVARWADVSWSARLNIIGLTAAVGALLGYLAGHTIGAALAGAAVALALGALVLVIMTAPGALAATVALFLAVTALPFLGAAYTGIASGSPDPVGGAVALFTSLAVAVWLVHRWGHGRLWVSVTLLSASLLGSTLLVAAFPGLGLNAARIGLALVVAWRCDFFGWLWNWAVASFESLRSRDPQDVVDESVVDPQNVATAWKRRATAERLSADVLAGASPAVTVFHDVHVKGMAGSVGHVVVGPGGVRLIASVLATGPVVATANGSVEVPGVDLGAAAWSLTETLAPIAKALKVHPRDIELIIAVHGSSMETVRLAVLDTRAAGSLIAGNVTVVDNEHLLAAVDAGWALWGSTRVRQVSARARVKLRFAAVPLPADTQPGHARVSVLSADGAMSPLTDRDDEPSQRPLSVGDTVSVQTSTGIISNLRVASPATMDLSGILVVELCLDTDWNIAQQRGQGPSVTYVFPVDSVIRG